MSTILVRTKITAAEWAAFRKLAIDLGVPASELAGGAIRKMLAQAKGDPSPGHSVRVKGKR